MLSAAECESLLRSLIAAYRQPRFLNQLESIAHDPDYLSKLGAIVLPVQAPALVRHGLTPDAAGVDTMKRAVQQHVEAGCSVLHRLANEARVILGLMPMPDPNELPPSVAALQRVRDAFVSGAICMEDAAAIKARCDAGAHPAIMDAMLALAIEGPPLFEPTKMPPHVNEAASSDAVEGDATSETDERADETRVLAGLRQTWRRRRRQVHRASSPSPQASLREVVPLVVCMNVHEHPNFLMMQLRHMRLHLPPGSRFVLNCNAAMLAALRGTPAAALCHPVPLEKRRYHGSLLQGIVASLEHAMSTWSFDTALVLSSRSWCRRPVSLDELRTCRAQPPVHTAHADLQYTRLRGMYWVDSAAELAQANAADAYEPAALAADLFARFRQTRLARQLVADGHPLLHAPHEGLVLERAACAAALETFSGAVGEELYQTEAEVEEFAIQSLVHARGLRFAQLSDMGRPGDGEGLGAVGEHLPPFTKTLRFDVDLRLRKLPAVTPLAAAS